MLAQKRTLILLVTTLVTILALVLAGCKTAPPSPPPPAVTEEAPTEAPATEEASPEAPEVEPIIIGAVFNATGWMASYDQPPRAGAMLAVDEINAAGGVLGRPLRIIELDGKTDPATVGNVARQLIAQGAAVILAPSDFDIGAPASQAAQEAGLVGLSPGATSPLYGSEALGDLQFTLGMWNNIMGAGAAEFAYVNMGWRTAYVVKDTSIDYSLSLGEYFAEHFAALGGTVLAEDTYLQGDQDFSAQIQRIRALPEPPDVIFISSYMPDLGTIVRQTRGAGIEAPIMGGDCYDTIEFFEAVGADFGNDIYFATHSWMGPESGEDMVYFVELYEETYGTPPDNSFIALGWDAVHVLAQAIEAAGTTDGPAVARAMEEMEFELLTGKLTWSSAEEGHLTLKEVAIASLQGGVPAFEAWILPTNPPAP